MNESLIRIVKMEFTAQGAETFLAIFETASPKIAAFPGCLSVQLLRDHHDPARFFTYSRWESPDDLEKYRYSELFQSTWARTKPLFRARAEAWSVYAQGAALEK